MKTTFACVIAVVLVAGLIASCGRGSESYDGSGNQLAGVYVLDIEETLGTGSATSAMAPAARERLAAAFHPDLWQLDLKEGGTFALNMAHGGETFLLTGDWNPTLEGLTLRARDANGAAIPEDEQVDDPIAYDGATLRMMQGDQVMVLKKL